MMVKEKTLRRWLIFWELFIGLGALLGTAMFFIDPSGRMWGMEPMLPLFQKLPFADVLFQNFIASGIALLCVNGIPNIVAWRMLVRRHRLAPAAGIVCGALLMGWIGVQFYIFTFNPMSTAYFIFGVSEALTAYLLLRSKQPRNIKTLTI